MILDSSLNSVLSQHGAMEFHRRKLQFLGDLSILYFHRLLGGFSFQPLRSKGARSDGTPTTECFKASIGYHTVLIDLNLELHHIATSWSANKSGSNVALLCVHRAHIARVFEMVDYLFVIKSFLAGNDSMPHLKQALTRPGERKSTIHFLCLKFEI